MSSENIDLYNPDRLGDLLFIFHTNHKKYLNEMLVPYDLNLVQVLCLLRVDSEDNLCQKDLSDGFYLTKGAITKAIKKLERNGLIVREKSDKDKRKSRLSLTDKGKDMIPVIDRINSEWERKMGFDDLSDEFYRKFADLTFRSVELNRKQSP